MKSLQKTCRFLCGFWLLVCIYAVGVVVGLELMSPSNMRLWGIRALIFKSLGWCVLVHCGIVFVFTVMRKWMQAFLVLTSVVVLIVSSFIVGLSIGPDIETIRLQTAEALGTSTSNLFCVGGCLGREAFIVFRVKESVVLSGVRESVSPQSNVGQIIGSKLRSLNIRSSEYVSTDILKFRMKSNTIFVLHANNRGWWAVFFRNAIM